MSATTQSYSVRLLVVGCGLFTLLAVHVSFRYALSATFGFAEYRGLAPLVPFFLLGVYMLLLGGAAAVSAVRRGIAGIGMGAGLLAFAVEPVSSSFLWGDGCEVSSAAGESLVPEVTVDGLWITLYSWNGACSASLNTALLGLGLLVLGRGLWRDSLPELAFARWLHAVGATRSE
ncbi:hypothetical protein BRD04_01665 [Halobacteriales archaeon QS_9_67_17]|nr:MAG: hypothetical protein BRD04_01665 [Halobacteriales archaeon QS_9_67_17]